MNTNSKTLCETNLCYYQTATRTRFFHGMLLTDNQLRDEQEYHREARKRANRHLYGSGIVCGLSVEIKGLCVTINPGVALDCCGNLIEVCKCITLDFSKVCEKQFGSDCPPRQQPATGEPHTKKRYLVLRYVEEEIEPAPVLTPDTDCESGAGKSKCSASKIREGFCVDLSDKCPCPSQAVSQKTQFQLLKEASEHKQIAASRMMALGTDIEVPPVFQIASSTVGNKAECFDLPLPCTECGCCESAVALAVLEIDCENKTIKRETECECRRYVITPRMLNWVFSTLQHTYKPSDITALSAQIGDHASVNLFNASLTYEATMPAVKTEVTIVPGAVTPATAAAAAVASQEMVDNLNKEMNKQLKEMNKAIKALEKRAAKLTKAATPAKEETPPTPTTPATPTT